MRSPFPVGRVSEPVRSTIGIPVCLLIIPTKVGIQWGRTSRTARTTGVTACLFALLLTARAGWAFDPPTIIRHLTASQPSVDDFATDFVCVGDQNGDGFDDLLVNHGTWDTGYGDQPFSNRIELYYGGRQMDDQPDFVIEGGRTGPIHFGYHVNFLGRLTDSENPWWAVQIIDETEVNEEIGQVLIYEAGNALDNDPEFVLRSDVDGGLMIGLGRRSKPFDVNGDNFSDLIAMRAFDPQVDEDKSSLQIYFGGNEFDTIPDVSFVLNSRTSAQSRFGQCNASVGYDVNADGHDDVLFRYGDSRTDPRKLTYALFLGGDPMDTTAIWEFYEDRFQDTAMTAGFAMVPDVNGDGYDDWVIHYLVDDEHHDPTFRQGYYLFYGGRNPDRDPDIRLEGAPAAWGGGGEVVGGDINDDGFGDIIGTNPYGYSANGSIRIFFGSRWFSDRASISVNCLSQYGEPANGLGEFVGAIGNYSGDETLDFVTTHHGGRPNSGDAQAYILAGQRDWRVEVSPEVTTPKSYKLSLSATPNPFNNSIRIEYSVSEMSDIKLEIFDVSGRQVAILDEAMRGPKSTALEWRSENSGVFLVVLSSTNPNSEPKKIVRKLVCIR